MALLKQDWEQASNIVTLYDKEAATLLAPFTKSPIKSINKIVSGCANANFQITFEQDPPVLLRIYLRDKAALEREIHLHKLVQNKIPVAKFLYTDHSFSLIPQPYAVMEWIEGKLMRDVVLSGNREEVKDCAYSAGVLLSRLRQITFLAHGFFKPDLSIEPFPCEMQFIPYIKMCLNDPQLIQDLGTALTQSLHHFVAANEALLPQPHSPANLTHADFDPSNMLVKKIEGKYQITALLDWEFALSHTYMMDIGLFLRYSHRLPHEYEVAFIQGLEQHGEPLPATWKSQSQLMDILSLLSLLYDNRDQLRPNMKSDVKRLLQQAVGHT